MLVFPEAGHLRGGRPADRNNAPRNHRSRGSKEVASRLTKCLRPISGPAGICLAGPASPTAFPGLPAAPATYGHPKAARIGILVRIKAMELRSRLRSRFAEPGWRPAIPSAADRVRRAPVRRAARQRRGADQIRQTAA